MVEAKMRNASNEMLIKCNVLALVIINKVAEERNIEILMSAIKMKAALKRVEA